MPFVSRNKHSVLAQDRDILLLSVESWGDLVYDRKDLDLRFSCNTIFRHSHTIPLQNPIAISALGRVQCVDLWVGCDLDTFHL
jgi:hypothetical protein